MIGSGKSRRSAATSTLVYSSRPVRAPSTEAGSGRFPCGADCDHTRPKCGGPHPRVSFRAGGTASFKPLLCAGPPMRTAGPATWASLARCELLHRTLNPAAARRCLFGRENPTNPFVLCQGRQILPGNLRRRFRTESLAQIRRRLMYRTRPARNFHGISLAPESPLHVVLHVIG